MINKKLLIFKCLNNSSLQNGSEMILYGLNKLTSKVLLLSQKTHNFAERVKFDQFHRPIKLIIKQFLMKKCFQKASGILLYTLMVAVLFTSCVSQKKIKYFQTQAVNDSLKEFSYSNREAYKLKNGDNLYIKVHSLDEKTYKFFNYDDASRNTGTGYSEASIYLASYAVSDSGYIDFPFVGKIAVAGLTVDEIRTKIQGIVDQYLKETTIIVKLVNFRVTILGEVKNPGYYLIYQDKLNIFEAVARAGDLTDFSNRSRVVVVRQTSEGAKMYRMNMNDANIFNSEQFYLLPNDIVYVEPLKEKQWAFSTFPYTVVLSVISSTLLIMNYFK